MIKLSITADISVNNNNLIHKYKLSKKEFLISHYTQYIAQF